MDDRPLGTHFIVEFYECIFEVLDDEELLVQAFYEAIRRAGMNLLALSSHKFDPQGVTAVALLSESHMSIHTYPELGYAALDVFTCGEEGLPIAAMLYMQEVIKPGRTEQIFIMRGCNFNNEQ